jgi:Zn-dependent M28 family amino/carboxypeptidase
MITVRRTVSTRLDATRAFDYLCQFEHTSEWDPGTPVMEKTSPGPVAVGTTYHAEAEFRGKRQPLDYVVTELGDSHLKLRGENKSVVAFDSIDVRPSGAGAEVTYTAEFSLKGLAKLATPFAKPMFEKLGDPAARGMKDRLDGIAAATPGA